MFAEFNLDDFPFVKVKFNKNVLNDEDFNEFLQSWLKINKMQKNYMFVFDTRNLGVTNPIYVYRLAKFIKELKKQTPKYLQKSIIIVNNKYLRYLLEFLFTIQDPVSQVFIVDKIENSSIVIDSIKNNYSIDEIYKKEVCIITPD